MRFCKYIIGTCFVTDRFLLKLFFLEMKKEIKKGIFALGFVKNFWLDGYNGTVGRYEVKILTRFIPIMEQRK